MTARERILTALNLREPDRVPIDFHAWEPEVRERIEAADLDPAVKDRFLRGDCDLFVGKSQPRPEAFAAYHRDTPPKAAIDEWGRASIRHHESGEYLLTRQMYYPLLGIDDPAALDDYPWPDMAAPERWEGLAEAVQQNHEAGRATIGQASQTIIEMCYELRSMEQLFRDFYERPGYVERLFEIITNLRCEEARRLASAGVDILRIGDDLADQREILISPSMYRDWVKPCHAAVIRAAHQVRPGLPVIYHSDGQMSALIPELVEIGVTAVNPVQPECMDPLEVKRRWGITVWGAVGTQSTLAFGTEQDVWAEMRERMERLAPGGGWVVNFVNTVWSPTARRNVVHYLEAVQKLGVY